MCDTRCRGLSYPGGELRSKYAIAAVAAFALSLPLGVTARAHVTRKVGLTVAVVGRGKVTSTPRGISCPRRCRARFERGTRVRLQARPRRGWRLSRFAGVCSKRRCAFALKQSSRVRAVFVRVRRPPPPPPPPPSLIAKIVLGGDVLTVAVAADGSIWSTASGRPAKIDPLTNQIAFEARIHGEPATGHGSIWVAAQGTLYRLDAATGAAQAAIAIDSSLEDAYTGAAGVWLASRSGPVARVDPQTNTVTGTAAICGVHGNYGALYAAGSLWLACYDFGEVVRVDPLTLAVARRIAVRPGVHSLTFGDGSIWAINSETAELDRIDPTTNTVSARLFLPPQPPTLPNVALTSALGAIWVAYDQGILKIDPQSNGIVGKLVLGAGEYYGMTFASGSLWVTTVSGGAVLRLDPGQLAPP